jgi:hypothetical protein
MSKERAVTAALCSGALCPVELLYSPPTTAARLL